MKVNRPLTHLCSFLSHLFVIAGLVSARQFMVTETVSGKPSGAVPVVFVPSIDSHPKSAVFIYTMVSVALNRTFIPVYSAGNDYHMGQPGIQAAEQAVFNGADRSSVNEGSGRYRISAIQMGKAVKTEGPLRLEPGDDLSRKLISILITRLTTINNY